MTGRSAPGYHLRRFLFSASRLLAVTTFDLTGPDAFFRPRVSWIVS